ARDAELTANIRAARRPLGERARELADPIALVRHRPALRQPEVVVDAAGRRLTGGDEPAQLALQELDWTDAVDRDGSVTFYRGGRYDPERELEDLEATVTEVRSAGGLYTESLPVLYEQLAELDVPTVIVIPPLPTEDLETVGLGPEELDDLADDIRSGAAEFGLAVVDFSRVGYPREYFADRVHLNNAGSRQFSADLARTLDGL
ncbi:MAG: D-alanyl-lipoteichoic acid biosynthesis protein DltD, partial [Actinomycetota bacterium]